MEHPVKDSTASAVAAHTWRHASAPGAAAVEDARREEAAAALEPLRVLAAAILSPGSAAAAGESKHEVNDQQYGWSTVDACSISSSGPAQ